MSSGKEESIKLHEIVAVRKGVKSRTYSELTELHKKAQKETLYSGLTKVYRSKDEEGEKYPDENKHVQANATEVLRKANKILSEAWDVEATQEYGNRTARADVIVDGQPILTDVPATFLLYLEKQLSDLHTFANQMPTLAEDKVWSKDPNSHLFRSDTVQTTKTTQMEKPQVVIPPTEHHPGQWTTFKETVVQGTWDTTHLSGALPLPEKEALVERVEKLRNAVKRARSRANDTEVLRQEVAAPLLAYLLP